MMPALHNGLDIRVELMAITAIIAVAPPVRLIGRTWIRTGEYKYRKEIVQGYAYGL